MAGSAFGFATGRLNIVQTLLSKPDADGRSELPLRRTDLLI
jgi:cyclopropane-fatty-acyl-phospholipid synthase